MATRLPNAGLGGLPTLFEIGSSIGLSDAQLLERYINGDSRSAEAAFAALREWSLPAGKPARTPPISAEPANPSTGIV